MPKSGSGGSLPSIGTSLLGNASPDRNYWPSGGGVSDVIPKEQYAGMGKFPTNLVEDTQFKQTGMTSQVGMAQSDETGFVENLLGGMFGILGQDARNVGAFLGSVVDLPMEAAGNVLGAAANIGSIAKLASGEYKQELDPEFLAMYEKEAQKKGPFLAWQAFAHAKRAQYDADVESGRMPRLFEGIYLGPSDDFGETLLNILSALGVPMRVVQRGILGLGGKNQDLADIMSTEKSLANPAYQAVRERYLAGDFGPKGSQQARDAMLDTLVAQGQMWHGSQTNPQGLAENAGQFLTDLVLNMLTDPIIVGGMGLNTLARRSVALLAERSSSALGLISADARTGLLDKAIDLLATEKNISRAAAERLAVADPIAYNERMLSIIGKEHPDALEEATKRLGFSRMLLEARPLLQPITRVIDAINNPQNIFGSGPKAQALNTLLSTQLTEAGLRAFNFTPSVRLLEATTKADAGLGQTLQHGFGTFMANVAHQVQRNDVVRSVAATRRLPSEVTASTAVANPTEVISAGLKYVTGKDIANHAEMLVLRFKKRYLPTARGEAAQRAALETAREEAFVRLKHMSPNTPDETIRAITSTLDEDGAAFIDASYYGHIAVSFNKARDEAVLDVAGRTLGKGEIKPEHLAIIGPGELTMSRAKELLEAIKNGDVAAIREAIVRYDYLYETFGERPLKDAKIMQELRHALEQGIDEGHFITELPPNAVAKGLIQKPLIAWADEVSDVGYRLGFRPGIQKNGVENLALWRPVMNEAGDVVAVSPWLDVLDAQSAFRTWSKWDLAKERFLHDVRGERIIADARYRFARYTATQWEMPKGISDGIFSRLIKAASETRTTPRGMTPEAVYRIISDSLTPSELENIGVRNVLDAVMVAFEGDFWHVGWSQKFTGKLKTATAGESNYIGMMAERVYPLIRFQMNLLFQLQELLEPFILNIARGVKPGFKPSDWDAETLKVIQMTMRHGRYALDDAIEQTDVLLWGKAVSVKEFGVSSRIGRMYAKLGINVKSIKQLNYARLTRERFGKELRATLDRINPELGPLLEAEYLTRDWGEIAIRYMQDKGGWASGQERQAALRAALKPGDLGMQSPVNLDHVAALLDDPAISSGMALRDAFHQPGSGVDADRFVAALTDAKADPQYISRALQTVSAPYTPDQWWEGYRVVFSARGRSGARAGGAEMGFARELVRARADAMGITEHEYLARRMAEVPMSAESSTFASVSHNSDAFLFQVKEVAEREAITPFDRALDSIWRRTQNQRGEMGFVLDDFGNIVDEAPPTAWYRHDIELGYSGEFTPDSRMQNLSRNLHFVHSHPTDGPLSIGGDLASAHSLNVASMTAIGPTKMYRMQRPPGGWPSRTLGDREVNRLLEEVQKLSDEFITRDPNFELLTPVQHYYAAQTLVLQGWADRVGATFTVSNIARPVDKEEALVAIEDWLKNPPVHMAAKTETEEKTVEEGLGFAGPNRVTVGGREVPREVERVSFGKQVTLAFEYSPGTGSEYERFLPQAWELPDEAAKVINEANEQYVRMLLAKRGRVLITGVRNGKGGWLEKGKKATATEPEVPDRFLTAPNTVYHLAVGDEEAKAAAALLGLLDQQTSVMGSRLVRHASFGIPDPSKGESWAFDLLVTRNLSEEEAVRFGEAAAEALPDVSYSGHAVVDYDDGSTAIRFVTERQDATDVREFLGTHGVNDLALGDIRARMGYGVGELKARPVVVKVVKSEHDWTEGTAEAARGEGHRRVLREAGGHWADAERVVDDDTAAHFHYLAELYEKHAPEALSKHLEANGLTGDDLRGAMGGRPTSYDLPDVGLGETTTIPILGGRERLLSGEALSIHEGVALMSQGGLHPGALWAQDPELTLALYKAIQRAHVHSVHTRTTVWNSISFAMLSAGTNLSANGAFWNLIRASRPGRSELMRTIDDVRAEAAAIIRNMGPDQLAIPKVEGIIGLNLQLERGLIMDAELVENAPWLNDASRKAIRTALDEESVVANRDLSAALAAGEDEVTARARISGEVADRLKARSKTFDKTNKTLPEDQRTSLSNLSFSRVPLRGGKSAQMADWQGGVNWFIKRPRRFESTSGNTNLGRLVRFADRMRGASRSTEDFFMPQPWETLDDWGLRLASVTPGLSHKTARFHVQQYDPVRATVGVFDTHLTRATLRWARERGYLDELLSELDPTYAAKVKAALDADGLTNLKAKGYSIPKGTVVQLVKPSEMKKLSREDARALFRTRLKDHHPDGRVQALYQSNDIVDMALDQGSRLYLRGGDYDVMDKWLARMRAEEAASFVGRSEAVRSGLERMSNAMYGWMAWERQRAILDPHLLTMAGIEKMPTLGFKTVDKILATHERAGYLRTVEENVGRTDEWFLPHDQDVSAFNFAMKDGVVQGANVHLDDGRRILVGTEAADRTTGLHELAHVFHDDLDPSGQKVVLDAFNKANGRRLKGWNREVSEWFADEFLRMLESGRPADPSIKGATDYFGKWLRSIHKTVAAAEARQANASARKTEMDNASAGLKTARAEARAAERALAVASTKARSSFNRWATARGRKQVNDLERAARDAADAATRAVEERKAAATDAINVAARLKALEDALKVAEPAKKGGFTAARNKGIAAKVAADARLASAKALEKKALKSRTEANRAYAAARRRTPTSKFSTAWDKAAKDRDALRVVRDEKRKALRAAEAALEKARGMRPARAGATPKPLISDEMRGLFHDLFKPHAQSKTVHGMKMDYRYDNEQEAVFRAAEHALRRAEEEAFTVHYYKRGRSFLERSINHPYFGLYPFSYMWAKMLPEMIRFLVKSPFGIPAPLAGMRMSQIIYRQVMLQQQYDPELRKWMKDHAAAFRLASILMPALPWEVPVNAPLWTRRIAQIDAENQARVAGGFSDRRFDEVKGGEFTASSIGGIAKDVSIYAFGPANTFEYTFGALDAVINAGSATVQAATDAMAGQLDEMSAPQFTTRKF